MAPDGVVRGAGGTGHRGLPVYLNDIPLPLARSRLQEALIAAGLSGLLGEETLPLDERASGGRSPVGRRVF